MREGSEVSGEDVGIVPIAFPLLVGPGAITTTMISLQSDGLGVATPSILLVMLLTWTVLRLNDRIHRLLGRTGSAVIARVLAVFIADSHTVHNRRNTDLLTRTEHFIF